MAEEQIKVWTIRQLMKSAIEYLQKNGFDEARLNVELLLSYALDIQRIQLYVNFDKPLTQEEIKNFKTLFERRLKREPVQYIIGYANFMGLHFDVDPRVLIPRPETETLIEQVILTSHIYGAKDNINILEIGTGSGNIAISLAKYIKNSHITAVDISYEALALAKNNARKHSVESQIDFLYTDIFEPSKEVMDGTYDLIVSNPPYIPKDEWEQLAPEVKMFEPSMALTDGNDGYKFYYTIANLLPDILKPGGSVILELGFGQEDKIFNIFQKAGLQNIEIIKDLQGVPRVISGKWNGGPNQIFIGLN